MIKACVDTLQWKSFLAIPKAKKSFSILAILTVFILICFTFFLEWNETRPGYIIKDIILSNIEGRNTSIPIFMLTYLSVIVGIKVLIKKPATFIPLLFAVIIVILLRTISLLILPLEAPENIIPLRDFLLEGSFYNGKVLHKDLFFSGHTANVLLLGFMVEERWLKTMLFIFGFIVGMLLLAQKVHFTIDVLAAPIAAFAAAYIGKKLARSYFDYAYINS